MPRNVIITGSGKIRPVCEYCGRTTRSSYEAKNDRLSLADLPLSWSVLPFPNHVMHADGSTGTLHHCPSCTNRRDFPISPKLDR